MKYIKKGLCRTAILVTSLSIMNPSKLIAAVIVPDLINTIDTSQFTPASPDPAGIVYLPDEDVFLITDSEVNEMDIFRGVNVFKIDRDGNQIIDPETTLPVTFSTIRCISDGSCLINGTALDGTPNPLLPMSFSDEPSGITFNPDNGHCFISDDNGLRFIHQIDPGTDGICLTSDDTVNSIPFGASHDPEDVTFGQDSLFMLDGVGEKVHRLASDDNGLFNRIVSSFATHIKDTDPDNPYIDILNLPNPEGIVFDPTTDTLYITGALKGRIIRTTTYGVFLDRINVYGTFEAEGIPIPIKKPAGLALAPTSNAPTKTSLYLLDRGDDNDDFPTENDGKIYELGLPAPAAGNVAPEVSAGDDQLIILPDVAQLNGSATDDGLPNSGLVYTWSKISGPSEVCFTDANDPNPCPPFSNVPNPTASFTMLGDYVLRLTGYDGELFTFADVSITVESLPVITLIGDNPINLILGDTFTDPGAMALDDTDGVLTNYIEISSNVNTAVADTYSVTYTVTDSAYNKASATRTVIVRDNTIPPVITLNGANPLTLNLGDTFTDPGATAADDVDGNITATIQVRANVNTAVTDTYSVIYTVTDSDGNSASATRTVIVRDNTIPPVITLNGANPMTLNLGDAFIEPGATATDDTDGNLTASIVVTSTVNTAIAGTYSVTYIVTDSDKNTTSVSRSVSVRDNTIVPVLSLLGANTMHLTVGDTFTDPGATALDEVDGDLTASIVVTSNLNTSVAGTYEVRYSVTDSDGNSDSVSRSVIVSSVTDSSGTDSSSSSGGSTDRTFLLLLALLLLYRQYRKGNLL